MSDPPNPVPVPTNINPPVHKQNDSALTGEPVNKKQREFIIKVDSKNVFSEKHSSKQL